MENKKNLKALLEERKKKKLQKKNKKDNSSAAQEEEDTQPDDAAAKPDATIEEEADSKPAKKGRDNDDSSDDELKYKIEVKHEIVEQQADSSKKTDVIEVPDYMKQKDVKDDASKKVVNNSFRRADGNNIKFTGKPTFSNRQKASGILGDDFQGLDDIDDQGKQKKNQRKAAEGGKEFVHMGSSAVDKSRKQEEEKSSMDFKSASGRRPTFTGKAKIGGGASTEQTGPSYDFGVKYKTIAPDDAKKGSQEGKNADAGEGQTEVRKDKRKINQEKTRFGAKDVALDDQDLDEGFEIVKDPNAKRRQQRANRTREDDDFSRKTEGERKDAAIKRGGAFGNLGGEGSD